MTEKKAILECMTFMADMTKMIATSFYQLNKICLDNIQSNKLLEQMSNGQKKKKYNKKHREQNDLVKTLEKSKGQLAIRQPTSGWDMYIEQQMAILQKIFPNMSKLELKKKISQNWKQLEIKERKLYQDRFNIQKQTFLKHRAQHDKINSKQKKQRKMLKKKEKEKEDITQKNIKSEDKKTNSQSKDSPKVKIQQKNKQLKHQQDSLGQNL